MKTISKVWMVLLLVVLTACPWAEAVVVLPGYDTAVCKGKVRYRNFNSGNGGEIYLGVKDLGVPANRVEKDFYRGTDIYGGTPYGSWLITPNQNHIEFIYDKPNDRLITNVTCSNSYQLIWNNFSTTNDDPNFINDLNYMQISVFARATGTTVDLNNVVLDGQSLGDFHSPNGVNNDWKVLNYDFSDGFVLTADLVLSAGQTGGENNKVEIAFGHHALACGDCGFDPMDLNFDCHVDLLDFAIVSSGWLSGKDLDDLVLLAQDWLNSTLPGPEGCGVPE